MLGCKHGPFRPLGPGHMNTNDLLHIQCLQFIFSTKQNAAWLESVQHLWNDSSLTQWKSRTAIQNIKAIWIETGLNYSSRPLINHTETKKGHKIWSKDVQFSQDKIRGWLWAAQIWTLYKCVLHLQTRCGSSKHICSVLTKAAPEALISPHLFSWKTYFCHSNLNTRLFFFYNRVFVLLLMSQPSTCLLFSSDHSSKVSLTQSNNSSKKTTIYCIFLLGLQWFLRHLCIVWYIAPSSARRWCGLQYFSCTLISLITEVSTWWLYTMYIKHFQDECTSSVTACSSSNIEGQTSCGSKNKIK